MAETTRKAPTAEQRRKSLDMGVGLASAHPDLRHPGDFALIYAEKFADYLANGPAETAADDTETSK